MVGRGGETFSKRMQHFATSVRGTCTNSYWFKQSSRLTAMVDTLGLPTVFFTHSAVDMQRPELARLICPHPTDKNSCKQAVIDNPAIADWFFH